MYILLDLDDLYFSRLSRFLRSGQKTQQPKKAEIGPKHSKVDEIAPTLVVNVNVASLISLLVLMGWISLMVSIFSR